MATTSKVGTVLDALVAGLDARAALAEVAVVSGDMGAEWIGTHDRFIMFLGAEVEQEFLGIGQADVQETITIPGVILYVYPGHGEEATKGARDGALEVFAELESYISGSYTIGSTALVSQIDTFDLDAGPWPGPSGGHYCEIGFELEVTTTKIPS